jgi:ectoine hydroxylase-related dioxygenase (phytanoyl-CoA dioxygenase family)
MIIFKTFYYLFIKYFLFLCRQKIFNYKKNTKSLNSKTIKSLNKYGYCVIENYVNYKNCELIKNKIKKFIKDNPSQIVIDKEKSDFRIHGAELICSQIKDYFYSNFIKSIGENYSKNKLTNIMTMANKIKFKDRNKGSGNGWHRDGLHFQYKSILYLSDVNLNNGPFQIIENSKNKYEILKFSIENNINPQKTRFSNKLIKKKIKNKKLKLKTIVGKKGTLILVDTSCIHRGSPLKSGSRYAITNYYYPKNLKKLYKHQFSKMLKKTFI